MTPESHTPEDGRRALAQARRLVIKIGSRVLVQPSGRPEARRIRALIRDMARLRRAGREVVFVTSGAIGAGMEALGMTRRPTHLPDLQMAAAVGQSRLMTRYAKLFAAEGCIIGQVLLTHDDLKDRDRHLNARGTILKMLEAGVIPVVNENDVVAVEEIKFGDNDLLASLVVHLIDADLLVLLSTTDGLRAPAAGGRTRRVRCIASPDPAWLQLADGKGSPLSTGGMASKLASAFTVARTGAAVVIADGRRPRILERVLAGADTGTLMIPPTGAARQAWTARARWIAFFHKCKGGVVIDDGARRALEANGKSLLPIGIRKVEGHFKAGAAIEIRALDETPIARGISAYSSRELRLIQGRRTAELAPLLGADSPPEAVHRDNMVFLE